MFVAYCPVCDFPIKCEDEYALYTLDFCPKCGTEYQDGTKFCGKCGENVDGSAATAIPASAPADAATAIPAGTPVAAPAKPAKQGPGFFEKLLNTKDYTDEIGMIYEDDYEEVSA